MHLTDCQGSNNYSVSPDKCLTRTPPSWALKTAHFLCYYHVQKDPIFSCLNTVYAGKVEQFINTSSLAFTLGMDNLRTQCFPRDQETIWTGLQRAKGHVLVATREKVIILSINSTGNSENANLGKGTLLDFSKSIQYIQIFDRTHW